AGIPEAHHRAGAQRRRFARARAHGRHALRHGRVGRARQCRAGSARRVGQGGGMSVLALARPEIIALKAYSHASWDPAFDRLHANELPWRAETDRTAAGLNRYPEPHPHELAARLAELYGVRTEQLLPGRGSDESIDLVVRGFCRAGVDNVIICPPTFGMYSVAARIQGAQVREVPLRRADFSLDTEAILAACDATTRIVFVCSPNNPTGN